MKRILIFTVIVFAALTSVTAQDRKERVDAFRIAIFTEVLQLTPEEAQGFWPVYNEYLDRRETLQQQYKPNKQFDAMSDAEVEEQIKMHFERQQKDLDLEKDLFQKLRKVLPLRKIAKIPMAERQFRESLIKKMQENRDKRQDMIQRRPGGGRK